MTELFNTINANFTKLKNELREAHQNEYFNTPQDKCYNPQKLLTALSKAENALYDLQSQYGYLLNK